MAEFLMDGNAHGPCRKTHEELEEVFKGSVALCSWLVKTYSNKLYLIYSSELDPYFH